MSEPSHQDVLDRIDALEEKLCDLLLEQHSCLSRDLCKLSELVDDGLFTDDKDDCDSSDTVKGCKKCHDNDGRVCELIECVKKNTKVQLKVKDKLKDLVRIMLKGNDDTSSDSDC